MPYYYMLDATNLSSWSNRRDNLSRNFFLSITVLILHPLYIISFPHPDLLQLHLGLDHTKFTQDRPPVQSDIVLLCTYMAFLSTRKRGQQLTYSHSIRLILHVLAISVINSYQACYYSYSYYSTVLGVLQYITFLPFYLIVLIQT